MGRRLPCPCYGKMAGVIPPGTTSGELITMEDWLPTIMSQVGEPKVKDKLLTNYKAGNRSYENIHLDGYDQTPLITGKGKTTRPEFFYFTETTLHGVRLGDWKFLFKKQDKWFNGVQENMVIPYIINLKLDPFERFLESDGYNGWQEDRAFILPMAMSSVNDFVKSLQKYPPRMKSFDINVDEALKNITPKAK